jgi:DnaK suppressor protein
MNSGSGGAPDRELFRRKLLALRTELNALEQTGADAAQTVELDQTRVGRLSRMDAMQAQAMSKASNQRRAETLVAIEAALKRIERGDYGECRDCGAYINPRRLEFDPTARLCIGCASNKAD